MAPKKFGKVKLSRISAMHYFKLIFRSCLFLAATIVYIVNRMQGERHPLDDVMDMPFIMWFILAVFVLEMVLRFFPSKFESMGCQKQFARNYEPLREDAKPIKQPGIVTFAVFAAWIALNAVIGILFFADIIDEGILLLISLAYSVCDMICILFFCPFQTWFMKNRCCSSCRIYNWDYAMMFTPLVFVPGIYTWTLLGVALLLLIVWEIIYRIHPERFYESSNACLSCSRCPEKLCQHKKQLRIFLKKNKRRLILKGNELLNEKFSNRKK